MDIHRCRFVPYQSQSINALAFTHSASRRQTPTDLRLALGRENGDIEIWNPLGGEWFQEKVFRGSHGRTIEQLAWTQEILVSVDNKQQPLELGDLRLFSSGGSTTITEWDLGTGVQKRHAEGNFADIWCFAAQPQWRASAKWSNLAQVAATSSQLLAAGCSDGSILLFSTADNTLQYVRALFQAQKKKSKVISITWKDRNTVVAGFENSTIRVLDVSSRTLLRTMSVGRLVTDSLAVVWTVKCLPNGTIVSGDSTGELKVWDSATYSLVQRLKAHDADILAIAVNENGDRIVTAGVDRRTVVYQLDATQKDQTARWKEVSRRRFHQHDVKALALFESKELSVLASGGMDTAPIILPLRELDTEYHRTLPHLPQRPQMSTSSRERLMLTWWQRELLIWQVPQRSLVSDQHAMASIESPDHKPLARLQLKGDENISSAQISENGCFVVAASSKNVNLFQIRKKRVANKVAIKTRPIKLPAGLASVGASLVGFSHDSKWLYAVRGSNVIVLLKIVFGCSPKDWPRIHKNIVKLERRERKTMMGKLGDYRLSITCVAFSSDSRVICTGDLSGAIDTWFLEGREDVENSPSMNSKKTLHGTSNSLAMSDKSNSDSDSDSDSGSDSDSDSEDGIDSIVVHGQRWIRNPSGLRLPLLDSAILALNFKPMLVPDRIEKEAPLGLHATRHNPHPISHEYTNATELVVVTASHAIIEFDVLTAQLTDWSRRNPPSNLPTKFVQVRDRAMGTFWDCQAAYQRLYIYGSGFIFMLDLAHDIEANESQAKLGKIGKYDVREKRSAANTEDRPRLNGESTGKKRKIESGAGGKIKYNQWQAQEMISYHQNSRTRADEDQMGIVTGPHSGNLENNDDDKDDSLKSDTEDTALAMSYFTKFRKDSNGKAAEHGTNKSASMNIPKSSTQFMTHRYRSILGISTLSPSSDASSTDLPAQHSSYSGLEGLEIVLVERPLYDINLLPRFDGGQEW